MLLCFKKLKPVDNLLFVLSLVSVSSKRVHKVPQKIFNNITITRSVELVERHQNLNLAIVHPQHINYNNGIHKQSFHFVYFFVD